jgi:ammonium transporter Rh
MVTNPAGAVLIGSFAGALSTLGFQYVTPLLKKIYLHDTCNFINQIINSRAYKFQTIKINLGGVNNLHGMPGLVSGVASAIMAAIATRDNFNGDRMYAFYPSRIPAVGSEDYIKYNLENTEYSKGGFGRSAVEQGGYQMAALLCTIGVAIFAGVLAGLIMRLSIFDPIKENEDMFKDEPFWLLDETHEETEVKLNVETLNEKN